MMTSRVSRALALRVLRHPTLSRTNAHTTVRLMGGYGGGHFPDNLPIKVDIGSREVVGWGANGEENYMDDVHFPFPAVRFKEETAEISVRARTEGTNC